MSPALGYHRSPAPRASGILAGLDDADVSDLRDAYETMARHRHLHPRDFTAAMKTFCRLCRALRIDSRPFERHAMYAVFKFDEAVFRTDNPLPSRISA